MSIEEYSRHTARSGAVAAARITVQWDNASIEDVVAASRLQRPHDHSRKDIKGNVTAEVKNQPGTWPCTPCSNHRASP